MNNKLETISRVLDGTIVNQRVKDGYINLNQIANACGKRIDNWIRLESTQELIKEFDAQEIASSDLREQSKPALLTLASGIKGQRGGGGTWAHPDIAIQFAQWCSPSFALQVSKWIREWMTTGRNPLADIDRVSFRDELKDQARLNMTDQVKFYLEQIEKYDNKYFRGIYFSKIHDQINISITTETAKQMRDRISVLIGKNVTHSELIRDYFPASQLQKYISVCEASANYMLKEKLVPLDAVKKAIEFVLPANYKPFPINFTEHIKLTRQRVAEYLLDQRRKDLYRSLTDK